MSTKLEKFSLKLADMMIGYRWLVLALSVVIVGLAVSGAQHLAFSNNYRIFFGSDNPELTAFEEFQDTFSKSDNILFVLKPANGKTFSRDMMGLMEEITKEAWQIPYTRRVDSITNFQYSYAEGDDLTVINFVENGDKLTDKELELKQRLAVNEPILYRNLISSNVETVAVNAIQNFPEDDLTAVPAAVSHARAFIEKMRAKYPDVKMVLSGGTMMNMAFAEAGMNDGQNLTPIMYLVLILVMVFAVRSISGTVGALMVVFMSMLAAMGLAGYGGVQLTPISVTAPTIILTLAIADSIHIIVTILESMRAGMKKTDALRESLRINLIPVSITSLTTIVGFLTLNTLDSPPFQHLGNITAMGVGFAWILSLTLLPAVLAILPLKVQERKEKAALNRFLSAYSDFVIKYQRKILFSSTAVAILLIAMIPRIEINDQWVEYFDWRIPFRADAELAMKELGGTYMIEYSVKAENFGGVNEPEYLANLEKFTVWLRSQPEVMHVYSYADIIKRLNKNMHGDNPEWYRVPDNRDLAAQYLLLYEMSLPYGLDLNDRIDLDKSSTRLTAMLGNATTVEVRAFLARVETWLQQNVPSYMQAKATGPTVMFSYISERNIESMFKGNAVAIIIISLVIMVAIRSFGIGLLSIIPNTIPILMTMGLWALTYKQIGLASATVSSVALGIMVDDTVHFLTKYLRGRREKGLDRPEAVRYAFETVGKALIVTTVILTLGFLVMATSAFQINMQLGLITAVTMVIALIMDFLLLPALLLVGSEKK